MMDSSKDYLIKAGIPPDVIALVPAGVARENLVLPFSATGRGVKLLFAEPPDLDLLAKLNYILRLDIMPALASRAAINAAIDHYYPSK